MFSNACKCLTIYKIEALLSTFPCFGRAFLVMYLLVLLMFFVLCLHFFARFHFATAPNDKRQSKERLKWPKMQKSIDQFLKKSEKTVVEIVKEDVEEFGDFEGITCPICSLDLFNLSLERRESHVELCLLRPNQHKLSISAIKSTTITKSASEKTKASKPAKQPKQKPIKYAPSFKYLKFNKSNLKVMVDGFNYTYPNTFIDDLDPQVQDQKVLYFLSHFHSDHYIGLSKGWNKGTIWSSTDSIKLVDWKFKVYDKDILKPLIFDEWIDLVDYSVDDVGVRVKLFDANHCPGGAIFLFEEYTRTGDELTVLKRILHTGDFRVSFKHLELFKDLFIDEIYLDTTYLNPTYKFPNQSTIINETCSFLKCLIQDEKGSKNSILNYFKSSSSTQDQYRILVGSYSIGKEKLFLELAHTLNSKIFITPQRLAILSKVSSLQSSLELFETKDHKDCMIHVVNLEKLKDLKYLEQFKSFKIIKIRPTGWSYNLFQRKLQTKKRKLPEEECEVIEIDDDVEESKEPADELIGEGSSIPISESPAMPSPSPSTLAQTKDQIIDQLFIKDDEIKSIIHQSLQTQYYQSSTLQIPYSEHSSFKELAILGVFLNYGEFIPTVSVDRIVEFEEWFKVWKAYGKELRKDKNKRENWFKKVSDYYNS